MVMIMECLQRGPIDAVATAHASGVGCIPDLFVQSLGSIDDLLQNFNAVNENRTYESVLQQVPSFLIVCFSTF